MEPEPPLLPRAGADPSRSEPESALGLWQPGAGARAAQNSGGSATLQKRIINLKIIVTLATKNEAEARAGPF